MFLTLLAQFAVEFLRALLIDGLSERVRDRALSAQTRRRVRRARRLHSQRALRLLRSLSTAKRKAAG